MSLTFFSSPLLHADLRGEAVGRDAAGWLHQGMAQRLILDMGIHLDSRALMADSLMNNREAQLRRQIYWSLYCTDKLASSYTGRVCTMLVSQKGQST